MESRLIPGTEKYEGLIKIFQTEKYSDIWVSEDNRVFERNEYGSFTQINKSFVRNADSGELHRNHSEFNKLTEYEIQRAQKVMEQLCGDCNDESYAEINDIFAYDFPITIARNEDPKILELLIAENIKAKKNT